MKNTEELHAIILAAGKGTRMKSDLPKVLHTLKGTELILYVIDTTINAGIRNIYIVVGFRHDLVKRSVESWLDKHPDKNNLNVKFILQTEQLGTGHAVLMCKNELKDRPGYSMILLGDVPLIKPGSIKDALHVALSKNIDCMVLSMKLENPAGYGRILRNLEESVMAIREEKDASNDEKSIKEVNTGTFIFNNQKLWGALDKVRTANSQKEYYLTDVLEIMVKSNDKIDSWVAGDSNEFQGVNSVDQLKNLEAVLG